MVNPFPIRSPHCAGGRGRIAVSRRRHFDLKRQVLGKMAWKLETFIPGQTLDHPQLTQLAENDSLLANSPQVHSVPTLPMVGSYPPGGRPNFQLEFGRGDVVTNATTGVAGLNFTAPFPHGVVVVIPRPADGSDSAHQERDRPPKGRRARRAQVPERARNTVPGIWEPLGTGHPEPA
jgi:hypothetical protein